MRFNPGDTVKLPPYVIPTRGKVIDCLPPGRVQAFTEEVTTFVVVEILVPRKGVQLIIIDEDDLENAEPYTLT